MATKLSRTPSSTGSNSKFTFSAWVKRTSLGALSPMLSANAASQVVFDAQDELGVYNGASVIMETNRKFRDISAWYHIVVTLDATESGTDKAKLYINGVQETSFKTDNRSSFSTLAQINQSGVAMDIGSDGSGHFVGLMSHIHLTDGYAYQASTFGSTDSTSGEWKINTSPSVTYGTNGFFILKDSNSVTDQSGQSNNFTVSVGTLTSTKDCPSNVYTTWNYLNRSLSSGIQGSGYGNGGTFIATETANNHRSFGSTLAFPGTGKFYSEFKIGNLGGAAVIGIMESEEANTLLGKTDTGSFSDNAKGWGYKNNGYKENGGSSSAYGASFVNYSYLMLAYNNGALWFGKDGTWANSATATEIANATTGNAAYSGLDTTKNYYLMFRGYNDSMIELNAGNGHFRTTTDGSNNPSTGDTNALFKYAVPTGLQPVSTKGFNA